jgi:hypothetical protein
LNCWQNQCEVNSVKYGKHVRFFQARTETSDGSILKRMNPNRGSCNRAIVEQGRCHDVRWKGETGQKRQCSCDRHHLRHAKVFNVGAMLSSHVMCIGPVNPLGVDISYQPNTYFQPVTADSKGYNSRSLGRTVAPPCVSRRGLFNRACTCENWRTGCIARVGARALIYMCEGPSPASLEPDRRKRVDARQPLTSQPRCLTLPLGRVPADPYSPCSSTPPGMVPQQCVRRGQACGDGRI